MHKSIKKESKVYLDNRDKIRELMDRVYAAMGEPRAFSDAEIDMIVDSIKPNFRQPI